MSDTPLIPRPSPNATAMFYNTNRNSIPFLRAVGINQHSTQHKELKKTVQSLYRQYLHPFKQLEEQEPDHVDQLIAKAIITLPWLDKYEDGWPARIYLKRFVDARRPHLMCTRYAHGKKAKSHKSKAVHKEPTRNVKECNNTLPATSPDSVVRGFLASLTPSLEHHLEAFVTLGIKDRDSLSAFLSWPQIIQAQFLDETHGVLQLTTLERKSLLVDCGLLAQKALKESPVEPPQPGKFNM